MNNTNIPTSSEEIKPTNKEDVKCAPGREFKDGSCYKHDELLEIAKAYNKSKDNKINLSIVDNLMKETNKDISREQKNTDVNYKKMYSKYDRKIKRFLVRELNDKMKDVCKDQQCWVEQDFMKNMDENRREHLQTMVLRPEGPSTGRKWLNTENIDKCLIQYEIEHKDFKYLGTMPRDFQSHSFLAQNEKFYEKLIKEGKVKMGMVYNTDTVGGKGEHWNALFVDFKEGSIEFFDSYGKEAEVAEEVHEHMELLKKVMQKNCDTVKIVVNKNNLMLGGDELQCKIPEKKINKHRHQYKGSECGVYSMNFIIKRLEGKSFDEICKSKIPDDEINKMRKIYFRQE
jgi:hypothetical protein